MKRARLRESAPFASEHRPSLTTVDKQKWRTLYDAGARLQDSARFDAAIDKLKAAAEIDDHYADLHFRRAMHCRNT